VADQQNEPGQLILRLHPGAWGIVVGSLLGIGLFVATNILVLKGGERMGWHLNLLSIYLPGYQVSFLGSLIGLGYLFAIGYGLGWLVAALYNRLVTP